MAYYLKDGTFVGANLTPSDPRDTYPTHLDIYGRGGYKAVGSDEERDAIPDDRLSIGCEVRVTNSEGSKLYYLKSLNPRAWELVKSGGLDDDALNGLKGQPGGLAELDGEGYIPDTRIRNIIFRGRYENNEFYNNKNEAYMHKEDAIYIDNTYGRIYTWSDTQKKFLRDTIYWQDI